MTGTIKKIWPATLGQSGKIYQRIEFTLADGKWAQTYLCQSFRNFAGWKPVLKEGLVLDNLKVKAEGVIDADSKPHIFTLPNTQA